MSIDDEKTKLAPGGVIIRPQDNNDYDKNYERYVQRLEQSREERLQKIRSRQAKKLKKKRRAIVVFGWLLTLLIAFCVFLGGFLVMRSMFGSHNGAEDNPVSAPVTEQTDSAEKNSAKNNLYKKFDYYIEENYKRYVAYASKNPDMEDDDVVWQVNMNLDKPKYSYDIPASDYDDPFIIVNKYYKVPEDFTPPDMGTYDDQLLVKEVGDAFIRMRNEASNQGLEIQAVSGYRSVEHQKNLYNSYLAEDDKESVDRYSARPGYSEHHTGMAIDLYGSVHGFREFVNTDEYPWVRDNAYRFGFIIRYPEDGEFITGYEHEPWHIRYVGVEVATQMKEMNISTYEEYYAKYIQNK